VRDGPYSDLSQQHPDKNVATKTKILPEALNINFSILFQFGFLSHICFIHSPFPSTSISSPENEVRMLLLPIKKFLLGNHPLSFDFKMFKINISISFLRGILTTKMAKMIGIYRIRGTLAKLAAF